jgi:hypothetical protein
MTCDPIEHPRMFHDWHEEEDNEDGEKEKPQTDM